MHRLIPIVAASLLVAPVPAYGQDTRADAESSSEARNNSDDGNPRLGLLGLLGLAGLLGLFRREPDIHVDLRNDPQS